MLTFAELTQGQKAVIFHDLFFHQMIDILLFVEDYSKKIASEQAEIPPSYIYLLTKQSWAACAQKIHNLLTKDLCQIAYNKLEFAEKLMDDENTAIVCRLCLLNYVLASPLTKHGDLANALRLYFNITLGLPLDAFS